jgi:hypothetical protein
MTVGHAINQLRRDPHPVTGFPDAAFKDVPIAKLP